MWRGLGSGFPNSFSVRMQAQVSWLGAQAVGPLLLLALGSGGVQLLWKQRHLGDTSVASPLLLSAVRRFLPSALGL